MDILSRKIEAAFVVTPEGRLDTSNAHQAEKRLVDTINAGEKRVVFDFCKTDYISSAGLRVILQAARLDMHRPLAACRPGGPGIHLTRELMDELSYRREAGRNIVTLTTRLD